MHFIQYLNYCPPGVPFYDVVDTGVMVEFPLAKADAPPGWIRGENAEWIIFTAPAEGTPRQGWKIHVSATPDNAEKVLEVVWQYCVPREVNFKFLRSVSVLHRRNGKYGDRGSTGKFVTIYPRDEQQLEQVLNELGDLLEGERGPYILSDLRWRSGPLFVRYGAFVEQTIQNELGETVYCVEDPDGRLVPDVRGPAFRPPEWAKLPACLEEALAARNTGTLTDFPFRATKAFHFSNGGGVYYATDTRSGEAVVLKEARPLAGLDQEGRDAVARLEREHWALDRLDGLPWVPKVIDYRIGHEHYFLAREYVEGQPLAREVARRNPLLQDRRTAADFAAYTEWALQILRQVEQAVAAMHERGVVFGDLHPANILVRPDDTVAFIDLEAATEADHNLVQPMAAPGFVAPPSYTGTAVDRYCLGCIRLAIFLPMTALLSWGPGKAGQIIEVISEYFPVPADFVAQVRRDLGPEPHSSVLVGLTAQQDLLTWPEPGPAAWEELRAAIGDGILAGATPGRTDRLFPGDIAQFLTPGGGLNLAHGAAGVLWALDQAGTEVPAEHVQWLVDRTRGQADALPGLYDGLSGIAYALDRLGRVEEAREVIDRVTGLPAERVPGTGLHSGLAGVGLTLLHFARRTGDSALREKAGAIAERIVARPPAGPQGPPAPGLMNGAAGTALFLLRMYEETQDPELLRHAEIAVRRDLAAMGVGAPVPPPIGAPWRDPVVAGGSAGVAMVLHTLVEHRPDPALIQVRDALGQAVRDHVVSGSGLFNGRAGVLLALRHLGERPDSAPVTRQLADLAWHAVPYRGHLTFIGEQSLRLSADLATGAAGVLFALHAVLAGSGSGLPFLEAG